LLWLGYQLDNLGFEYWQGLIKYTSDLWNDIWKHYVYMMTRAVLEVCCDMINQLIHNKINSKIKTNVWIPSQHFGIDAQLPNFCPWNEMQEDEQGWKIFTSVFLVKVIWRKTEMYRNLEQMCWIIIGLSSKIHIQ